MYTVRARKIISLRTRKGTAAAVNQHTTVNILLMAVVVIQHISVRAIHAVSKSQRIHPTVKPCVALSEPEP